MRVEVNGVRLFYDVEGPRLVPDGPVMRERPVLLLLHGGPGMDHSHYRPWFSHMAGTCQVIYLDQRGNGRSDADVPEHWNLAQWGDDVKAFCEALDIEKPVVLGTSFGGFVAMSYATRYPEHPEKLILVGTQATFRRERTLAAFERLGGAEARAIADRALGSVDVAAWQEYVRVCLPLYTRHKHDPDADARAMGNPKMLFHFERNEALTFNLLDDLAKVRCPTLVIVGEDDPIEPPEDSEDIVRALPQHLVRFERFANAGHPAYEDEPRVFDVIRDFIATAS